MSPADGRPIGPRHLRLPRGRSLLLGDRPRVMGILNITPDSFSDGGKWLDPERALDHAQSMLEDGAEILDLGAESTRPGGGVYGSGARTLTAQEELDRLLPVLEPLRRATDAPLSVDTRKGAVARAALTAGADLINDVGGLADDDLLAAVATAGCPVIAMHSRGDIATMQRSIAFRDVVAEVGAELGAIARRALDAGIEAAQVLLDPGIGFGKTATQNLELLAHLDRLGTTSAGRFPLLVGASRKSFLASVRPAPPDHRLGGSLAAAAWSAQSAVAMIRVHDVAETIQFLEVWNAIHLARSARG